MLESFDCPECGSTISAPRYTPGLRLHCPECDTIVELPYLTRRIRPRRKQWIPGWAGVILTICLACLATFVTYQLARSRMRNERRAALNQILLRADEEEKAGRLDSAVRQLDAALLLLKEPGLTSPDHAASLHAHRDAMAAESARVSEALALESAEADLAVARSMPLEKMADFSTLFDLCERVLRVTGPYQSPRAVVARQRAESLAGQQIQQRGIQIERPQGHFLFDPDTVFVKAGLEGVLRELLLGRGYLPRREGSPLTALWDRFAPFRLRIAMDEKRVGKYMSSALDTFEIVAALELLQDRKSLWKNRIDGRTRQPASRVPGRLSGILGVKQSRDPDLERYLFDDAAGHVIDQLNSRLSALPPWNAALVSSPGT